jgi:hypothetical protein
MVADPQPLAGHRTLPSEHAIWKPEHYVFFLQVNTQCVANLTANFRQFVESCIAHYRRGIT